MEIIKRIFDEAALLSLRSRDDSRGNMTVVFEESISEIFHDFSVKENRTYSMRKREHSLVFIIEMSLIRWTDSFRL